MKGGAFFGRKTSDCLYKADHSLLNKVVGIISVGKISQGAAGNNGHISDGENGQSSVVAFGGGHGELFVRRFGVFSFKIVLLH